MRISREQLHEMFGKEHLSYSSLKYALGDMALWDMYMRGKLKKDSDALRFGSMYDMLLFEREKAMGLYQVYNDDSIIDKVKELRPELKNVKASKEYKEELASLKEKEQNGEIILVSKEDWATANEMIDRLIDCGLFANRMQGKYQVEFNTDILGFPVKGFLDVLNDDYITDSKSTRSIAKFRYQIFDLSYDIQAWIYTQVFDQPEYYWVAQEKAYPYYPAEIKCSEETLFKGEMKVYEALSNIEKFMNDVHKSNAKTTVFFESFEV